MSGRPAREAVMTALFNAVVASVATSFNADTSVGSATLLNPTTTAGLFLGLPVVGTGIPSGAVITNLSPLTLSLPANANGLQVSMSSGFLTTGRRLKFWSDVAAQPALFLRDGDEDLTYPQIVLQEQVILAELWIYANSGKDPEAVPVILLNNLLDAIQTGFAPDDPMQQRFTLGGLVFWCRISGKVTKSPGDIDGQAIAIVPVEITVP